MMNESYNDKIKEYRDNFNITYTLDDSNMFFETGYKVLQNQKVTRFIKCGKVFHNGKIKLIYDISKYRSLDSLLTEISAENYITVIRNLVEAVDEVKNNGFMQCENIDIDFNKVFVDANTLSIYLIYLPINSQTNANYYREFEKQLQTNIVTSIQTVPRLLLDEKIKDIQRAVKSPECNLKKIQRVLDKPSVSAGGSPQQSDSAHPSERINMTTANNPRTRQTIDPTARQPVAGKNVHPDAFAAARRGKSAEQAIKERIPISEKPRSASLNKPLGPRPPMQAQKPSAQVKNPAAAARPSGQAAQGKAPSQQKLVSAPKQPPQAMKKPAPEKKVPPTPKAAGAAKEKQQEETFFPPFVEEQKAEGGKGTKAFIITGIQVLVAIFAVIVLLFVNLDYKAKIIVVCLLVMIDIVASLLVALSDFRKKEITSVIDAEDFALQANWNTEMELDDDGYEPVPVTELKHDFANEQQSAVPAVAEPPVEQPRPPKKKREGSARAKPRAEEVPVQVSVQAPKVKSQPAAAWPPPAVMDETTTLITSDLDQESDSITVQLEDVFTPSLCLVGTNTPVRVRINIDKAEFVIGKNVELADGVIQFNKAISRIHCKVSFQDSHYYITDMGSSNGTYVNGVRTTPGRLVPIAEADSIILANSEFIVKSL